MIARFKKALGDDVFFYMEADGIDASIYRDQWKNTQITTEVARFNLYKTENS